MSTMNPARRIVKAVPADRARTAAARQAHETALKALDRAITACKRLARTGDSKAAREGRVLAAALHRLSDPLFQTFTPLCEGGRWVR
jgi:hypothetical protein